MYLIGALFLVVEGGVCVDKGRRVLQDKNLYSHLLKSIYISVDLESQFVFYLCIKCKFVNNVDRVY